MPLLQPEKVLSLPLQLRFDEGYTYELAFRQFEVSDTRVFDRPQAGRSFFEGVIRDHEPLGADRMLRWWGRALINQDPSTARHDGLTSG